MTRLWISSSVECQERSGRDASSPEPLSSEESSPPHIGFPSMGVSKNGGFIGEHPIYKWMIWGYAISGNLHIYIYIN
jgi:hypothetical protein